MYKVESPCVRNCCLDADDICMGCLRTLDEIKDWSTLTEDQKSAVLSRCQKRKTAKINNSIISNRD